MASLQDARRGWGAVQGVLPLADGCDAVGIKRPGQDAPRPGAIKITIKRPGQDAPRPGGD